MPPTYEIFTFLLQIQPASFCADYPVTNYSLEVTQVGVGTSGMLSTSVENFIEAILSEDAIYVFILSATNSVGTVSTNLSQEICKFDCGILRFTSFSNACPPSKVA